MPGQDGGQYAGNAFEADDLFQQEPRLVPAPVQQPERVRRLAPGASIGARHPQFPVVDLVEPADGHRSIIDESAEMAEAPPGPEESESLDESVEGTGPR